jgi:hypothetical protein
MELSNAIRAKLQASHPSVTDEQLNVLIGVFALCTLYNHGVDEPVPFGESLAATLNSIHECFCEEDIYAYCVRRLAEMQDEVSPIAGAPKKGSNTLFLG